MCGIVGIISSRPGPPVQVSVLERMRDTMIARGPDDAGTLIQPGIALGHRRLAIRDLHAGRQPWISQNGRFAIVFNGEIYNDDLLAAELAQEGVRLTTTCDTEVLAESWARWQQHSIEKLRGMFAFGVVDLKTNDTWVVRDRLGIKPLYYSIVDGNFVFASSISAIRSHPRFSSQPDMVAISHYLQTLRTTMGRRTMFDQVSTVLPGEFLKFENGKLTKTTYWTIPTTPCHEPQEFAEQRDCLEKQLAHSVQIHLKSDVTVGMMMSGGVDSNTLASMTRESLGHAFVGICGGGVDGNQPAAGSDFEFAQKCASLVDANFDSVHLSQNDYLDSWHELLELNELPLATPTDAIIFQIAKRLKQDCGVALGGEGADEAFCGYSIQHWSGNDYDRSRNPQGLSADQFEDFRIDLLQQYGRTSFSAISEHYLSAYSLIPQSVQRQLFQSTEVTEDMAEQIQCYYDGLFGSYASVPSSQRYACVLLRSNLESLLSRLDSATMAASLEARVPYADHKVIEAAAKIPHHFKIDVAPEETQPWRTSLALASRGSLRSKRILRSVAAARMPDELAMRPKQSFPTPLMTWLDSNAWRRWIDHKIQTSSFARRLFKSSALSHISNLDPARSLWKWPILNVLMWGDRCFE
ncbi:MAG: asparagine synthase (glutamine-hydrolyzing) [Planctomycetota bacterium]